MNGHAHREKLWLVQTEESHSTGRNFSVFLVKRSSMENACVFFGLGKVRWSSVQPHLASWVSTMDCAKSVRGMQVHKKREIYFYGIGIPCMNLRDYESFVSTM